MVLDCNVQTRLEKCALATIAKYAYATGNFRALKSASALVRWIVEEYANILCKMEDTEQITFSDEADELLSELGIFPRTAERGYMRNLQEQSGVSPASSTPTHWRDAKPALRTTSQRKLQLNVEDEASMKQEIERALQSTQFKAAIASSSNDNSAYEAALIAKTLAESRATQETISEPDEGEFSASIAREQFKP